MENVRRAQDLIGNEIYDRDGNRIGRVGNVYVDDSTHQPEWVTVRTGMFGAREHFVPLEGASAERNRISVGVSKDKVRDAPQVDAEQGHLSDTEGQNLYQHYGLQPRGMAQPGTAQPGKEQPSTPSDTTSSMTSDTTGAESSATAGTAGMTEEESSSEHPTGRHARTRGESTTASTTGAESATSTTESGMTGRQRTSAESTSTTRQREGSTRTRTGRAEHWGTGERRAPQSMVRYEERLRVDTETVETGRVRLRKYVVTERESATVPLSREEVRIEREPISDTERSSMTAGSTSGSAIGETEQEIILREERPVLSTEPVPVERVRINTETVTEERTVHGDVRKEQFDIEDQSQPSKRSGQ